MSFVSKADMSMDILEKYKKKNGAGTISDMVYWAEGNLGLEMTPDQQHKFLCSQLRDGLRSIKETSPDGRKYRTVLSIPVEAVDEDGVPCQRFLWDDIKTAPVGFIRTAGAYLCHKTWEVLVELKTQISCMNDYHIPEGESLLDDTPREMAGLGDSNQESDEEF